VLTTGDLEVPKIRKQGLYITRGVSHCGLAIYIKKYLKAKEELRKLKSQVSTQAKISSFRNPHIKIDLLLLPRGQNPFSYYTL
jgi:hypothetical protein